MFHWFEDTYLDYPYNGYFNFLLNDIAKHNELHHYFPRAILLKSYWGNIKQPFIIITLIYIFVYYFNKNLFFSRVFFIMFIFHPFFQL
jgi:hypothetical protein